MLAASNKKKFVAGDKTDNFILGVGWGSIRESKLNTQKSHFTQLSLSIVKFTKPSSAMVLDIPRSKWTLLQNSDLFFEKWSFKNG